MGRTIKSSTLFQDINNEKSSHQIRIGELKIDRERYELHNQQGKLDLAKKEFDIIWLLASKPGKVFSREEIYRNVWGTDVIVGNRTIDVHISKLREKVGQEYIKTIKGIGYKIENQINPDHWYLKTNL